MRNFLQPFIALFLVIYVSQIVLAGPGKPLKDDKVAKKPLEHAAQTSASKINLPAWQKLINYSFPKLTLNKTTESEFNKLYPFIDQKEEAGDHIEVYSYDLDGKQGYSSLKFGFDNKILSWIDYFPSQQIKISNLLGVYGTPMSINSGISKLLNYYNFDDLSVSASKSNSNVYSITQSIDEKIFSSNAKDIKLRLPVWKSLTAGSIDKMVPGVTTKKELAKLYPKIKEFDLHQDKFANASLDIISNIDADTPNSSIFVIDHGLEDTNYKKVELVFKNDMLHWINLIPRKLTVDEAIKAFGNKYKLDNKSPGLDFYIFNNIVLTTLKKSPIVLNIGVLANVNSRLKNSLPAWTELNKRGVEGLVIDSTTENSFNTQFPNTIAIKQKQGNNVIYVISEGLLSTDYECVDLIFKDKKLVNIDLNPRPNLTISDIIKKFGNKFELDDKSDSKETFYTFDNVIVSVNKKTKLVNTIGII